MMPEVHCPFCRWYDDTLDAIASKMARAGHNPYSKSDFLVARYFDAHYAGEHDYTHG